MAGRHRDPLRPLTAAVIGFVLVVGIVVLLCYQAGIPSDAFWHEP